MEIEKVSVNILFFAKAKELVNQASSVVYLSKVTSFLTIVEEILQEFPSLAKLKDTFILSLNQDYITKDNSNIILKIDDEIAVIPPISGG